MKSILANIGRYFRQTDLILILLCLSASVIGFVMIGGIVYAEMTGIRDLLMQIAATTLGIGGMVVVSLFDYRMLARLWKLHVPAAILLVLITMIFGQGRGEADDIAWLVIPITENFSFSLQPSELLKISYVLSFAPSSGDGTGQPKPLAPP